MHLTGDNYSALFSSAEVILNTVSNFRHGSIKGRRKSREKKMLIMVNLCNISTEEDLEEQALFNLLSK